MFSRRITSRFSIIRGVRVQIIIFRIIIIVNKILRSTLSRQVACVAYKHNTNFIDACTLNTARLTIVSNAYNFRI